MKRLISLSILPLLLITSCAPGGNSKCSDGLCIKVHSAGPIKKDASIPIEIKIKADKDNSDVTISFNADPGIIIDEVADKADMTFKDKRGVVWKKKMKAGVENTITQNVHFSSTGDYTITVIAGIPNVVVGDSVFFVITEDGGNVYLSGTAVPLRTPAPLPTAPTPTFNKF